MAGSVCLSGRIVGIVHVGTPAAKTVIWWWAHVLPACPTAFSHSCSYSVLQQVWLHCNPKYEANCFLYFNESWQPRTNCHWLAFRKERGRHWSHFSRTFLSPRYGLVTALFLPILSAAIIIMQTIGSDFWLVKNTYNTSEGTHPEKLSLVSRNGAPSFFSLVPFRPQPSLSLTFRQCSKFGHGKNKVGVQSFFAKVRSSPKVPLHKK